jgi:hypothetical protein
VLEPFDLLARLVASVPPPRLHLLRYFGVLSSHAALRRQVVPALPPEPAQRRPPPATGDQLSLPAIGGGSDDDANENDAPSPNAQPLGLALGPCVSRRSGHLPSCGGPMRWLETALTKPAIDSRLAQLVSNRGRTGDDYSRPASPASPG